MTRPIWNRIVDAIAFAAFVLLTATGVLERYLLPPRSGRFTTIWGLDRHDWGSIHYGIAIVFLGAVAVHLVLHWRWIACAIRGRESEASGARWALGLVAALALFALALAPFLSPIETTPREGGRGRAGAHRAR